MKCLSCNSPDVSTKLMEEILDQDEKKNEADTVILLLEVIVVK